MKCVCPMGGDRTCPDDCLLAVWANLPAKDRKTRRKPIAEQLYKQGFTQEQIATQLGVSQSTIRDDLVNLVVPTKSKPTKTATNPKGAGRPKGKRQTKPRQTETAKDKIVALADQGISSPEIAAEVGVDGRAIRHELERERHRREGKADPEIERTILSMSAREKLDAAIRQHKRKLDLEFEIRCREECQRWLNEVSLPQYAKEIGKLEHLIRNREGVMDRVTYQKIRACLHPDRVQDPALKKRYEEAFRLFTELEKRVLNEKESPTTFRTMPRTYQDLMAMKAKVQAERKAKRHANPLRRQ
jgi:hypothetical protein